MLIQEPGALCVMRLSSTLVLVAFMGAVWCRRTDELVDGPNASHITPRALDRWEERLEDLFAEQPYDMLDAALSHTIQQFPMSIQVSSLSWFLWL